MTSAQLIKEIVIGFFEGSAILILFVSFIGKKDFIIKNKIKAVVSIFFHISFTIWATNYMPQGIHTIFITIFLVILLSFITQTSIFTAVASVAVCQIIITIMDIISILITSTIYKTDPTTVVNNPQMIYIASIVSKPIFLSIAVLVLFTKVRIFKNDALKKKNSFLTFIIFQVLIMTLIFQNLNQIILFKKYTLFYSILIFTMYFLIIILAILDYKERERILKVQSRFDAQVEHVRNMEQIMSTVRKEKHDFSNHMNTIQLLCKMNAPDALEKIEAYIAKLTTGLKSAYRFYNTGNDYINCLLAVKSSYAFEHDIRLNVDFQAPLSDVQIEDNDLISMMGNIVDNAFDAIMLQPDKIDRAVSVSGYAVDAKYYLSISNNGPMIGEKDLERIFENGYSTKSAKKADHGFGLYIAKQHVTRNKGQIVVSSSEDETRFLVMLNLKEQACGKAS